MIGRPRLPLVCALAVGPVAALAQPMPSEHAVAAQTLDGTTITIEYSRPVARGRALFGALVPWERPWTPGANWATTIDVDHDVQIDGRPLPKGKYSIWAIPRADRWTLLFDRRQRVFHTQGPNAAEEQLRVTVRPTTGPHAELLTWSFPAVARDAATLQLQWGTTVVPLHVDVTPTRPLTVSAADRAALAGSYLLRYPRPSGGALDSTRVEVVADGAGLHVRGAALRPDADPLVDLVPIADRQFQPVYRENGQPTGVDGGEVYVFLATDGKVVGFEVRRFGGGAVAWGRKID